MANTQQEKMATMLELPRELYLIICELLTPLELSKLAGLSRDHYIAVQTPLYSDIKITAFSQLVKLVATLTKHPVVSNISARQRLRWQSLSDAQLRERNIKHLDVVLDSKTATTSKQKVNGMLLSRCIGAISRSSDAVKIQLTLLGSWDNLLGQLRSETLPDVTKLNMHIGTSTNDPHVDSYYRVEKDLIWELCFTGSTFPDLREVDLDTRFTSPQDQPETLNEAAKLPNGSTGGLGRGSKFTPFYGLKNMRKIKLEYNDRLDAAVLGSLFGSTIIPQHLTTLDISYCPSLNFVKDLESLSLLLQRGPQLLQNLKLHLHKLSTSWDWDQNEHQYCADITDHPEWHLCNVVREAGQNIKTLDLALPYVCSRMFIPKPKKPSTTSPDLDYPAIPREPYETLPERLVDAGYKHRRLISWHGTCRSTDEWDDIMGLASDQGSLVSWEIVNVDKKCASWHLSDCLPLTYRSRDVVKRVET